MTDQSEPFFSNSEDDIHADSLKFKVSINERTISKLKEENSKQKEKIVRLEQQITAHSKEKLALLDRIAQKEQDYKRLNAQKAALQRTISIRTQRHETEQHQLLTRGEKEMMERKVRDAEDRMEHFIIENERLMKQTHSLLLDVEAQRKSKDLLEREISMVLAESRENAQKAHQFEKLYTKKLEILEIQNRQLKMKVEDLILQLKLHERREEIQGLLTYQDQIGTLKGYKYKDSKSNNFSNNLNTTDSKGSQLPYAETYRENNCQCVELSEEINDLEEMVELLKERNLRLEGELEATKQRCVNLQNIICADSNRPPRR